VADSDQADTATSASSAANADTLDGKDSSDFQASNPCSSGTLFHEGACIEIGKRGPAAFPNAEAVCLQAGRRLPTAAELQTFRLRGGQDFDTAEYTSQAWTDANGSTRPNMVMLVNPSGTQTPTSVFAGAAFRCVAAPSVARRVMLGKPQPRAICGMPPLLLALVPPPTMVRTSSVARKLSFCLTASKRART
jgi:hypothetical protein